MMWRSVDVGAVVASLLGDARVIAGAGGLDRQVKGVRVVSTAAQQHRVGGNDLVVAAAEALEADDGDWDRLIDRWNRTGVAAIAVHLHRSAPLPDALVAVTDRLDVPLITFPDTTEFADVTSAVLDALLDAQGRRLERVLDIHQRFTPVVLAGGGAAEIATILHSILECPVVVVDPTNRPTAVVPPGAVDGIDLTTVVAVRQPIVAGDHDYGHIIALTGGAELDDDGQLALGRASLAIAVKQAHATAADAEQERFAASSLEELMAGNAGDSSDVVERARSFGWDLTCPRAVLLASVDPWTDRAHLAASLATIAFAARATLGNDAIVWTRSSSVAALVAPATDHPAERRDIAERLRGELDQRVTKVTVSVGVGRRVDDPLQLSRSYLEASRAVDVGRWAKGRHVTEVFDELGLERLLSSTPADDLAEFVEQAVGSLVEHDRGHGTDLVATLGTWLETRNMAESARRLHVHHNTLKNRLDRIETIAGPVVTDSARSLECAVAIHVLRHYDGPWSEHGT